MVCRDAGTSTTSRTCAGSTRASRQRASTRAVRSRLAGATASLRDIEITCSCGRRRTMDKAFDRFASGRSPRVLRATGPGSGANGGLRTAIRARCSAARRTCGSESPLRDLDPAVVRHRLPAPRQHWDIFRRCRRTNAIRPTIENLDLTAGTASPPRSCRGRPRAQAPTGGRRGPTVARRSSADDEYRALMRGPAGDKPGSSSSQPSRVSVPDALTALVREGDAGDASPRGAGATGLQPRSSTGRRSRRSRRSSRATRAGARDRGQGRGNLPASSTRRRSRDWEKRPDVVEERAGWLDQRYAKRAERWGQRARPEITPAARADPHARARPDRPARARRRLSGRLPSRAPLRRRRRCSGLLIYTATTDSAGSLGGLIAQAEPDRLEHVDRGCDRSVLLVLRRSDLHRGRRRRERTRLNLAACHACALLPETSCEEMNVLLDRALLVGHTRGRLQSASSPT